MKDFETKFTTGWRILKLYGIRKIAFTLDGKNEEI